jgi:glycosyltransferase involved in cell wall biosynthesis
MKIIVFVEDFGATGVVRNTIAIATRLSETGDKVTLVAAKPDGVLRDTVPAAVSTIALTDGGQTHDRKTLMRLAFRRFRALVSKQRPDVVLSAGNHGHLLVLAGTRFLPCRTIVRVSNDLEHRSNAKNDGRWAAWKRRLKFRTILTLADRVVLVSGKLLDQVTALDPRLACKAVVIPNGVNIEAVQASAQEAVPGDLFGEVPVVLAMGRLVPQKNFATLLEAVAIARRSRELQLLLIGTGPLKAELGSSAERLGIGDAVRLIDPVTNPFPIIKRSAALVLPSWWEGSPNVLLEAIACGTPVVASRTAGNAAEILDNDRYGLLVDPGDAEQMAAAILRQLGSRAVLPGDRARQYDRRIALEAYAALVAEVGAR